MESLTSTKLGRFTQRLKPTKIPFSANLLADAQSHLEELDFPTTKNEEWKYTRVGKIASIEANDEHVVPSREELKKYVLDKTHHTVILVNGYPVAEFPSETSDLTGITIKKFSDCGADALQSMEPSSSHGSVFDIMNTLYLNDGLWIQIHKNTVLNVPISLIHLQNGNQTVHHTRIRIEAGSNSKAEIIQRFTSLSAKSCYSNTQTEIQLSSGAHIELFKLQSGTNENFLINREHVIQHRDSIYTSHTHSSGCSFVRNDIVVNVLEENAETNLFGTYLLTDSDHIDNHTRIDHVAPHCISNELYKGVIGGKATGVFNGKVQVHPNAQKINAFQSNANILNSEHANMYSKPELEIYADDVKCSHGSTTGQLDEEALFYLKARGISEKNARNLLVEAFLMDVLDKIENVSMKDIVNKEVVNYFEKSASANP